MGDINFGLVAVRWVHIFAAIAAGGGGLFMLVALHPAAIQLDEATRATFLAKVRKSFTIVVMLSILGLIASGFYNYLAVTRHQHQGEGQGIYHMLMGIKIMLAFGVFFLSSALAGRSKGLQKIRAKSALWLKVNILLIGLIVLLGAILRAMPIATNA